MNLSFLICMLLTPLVGLTQAVPDSLELKVDAVFQEYNSQMSPGAVIAIFSNGKVILKKGYGMSNLEHGIQNSPSTVFDIASLSKQFTGYAISTLIQEGKITVNDDIRKYLPFVPDFGKTITINHLLHHTSGLRDWPETLGLAGWHEDDACSFEDIMRMVKHQKDLDFEPGTRYSYSNTGYNLLAAIVEKITGNSFRQWMQDNVFNKLKMDASIIPEHHNTIIKDLADSYVWSDNKLVKCSDQLIAYGSSSMFTSLNDFTKWNIFFEEQLNKKNPVFTRMLEAGRLNNGDTVYYGFGLGLNKDGEQKRIAHTGWWSGFKSISVYYPDNRLSIIIFSNSGNFLQRQYAEKIADIMLHRKTDYKAAEVNIKNEKDVKLNIDLVKKYVGTYQLGTDWTISISIENDQLMCRSYGESAYPMTAKSDSTFWVDAYNNAITFLKDGSRYLLKYRTTVAKQIATYSASNEELNNHTGTYYSEELTTEYILTYKDGKLWMYHIRMGEIQLFPESDGESFGSSMGIFKFIKNDKLEVIGFYVTGSRVKNIHFIKR